MKLVDFDSTESYILDGRYAIEPPKHGYWIYEGNVYVAKCSECGNFLDMRGISGKANTCPHCGARMNEEAE